MLRRLSACLVAAAAAALVTPGLASAAGASPASGPAVCATTAPVAVGALTFTPSQVAPGWTSTGSVPVTDCTAAPQTVAETWYGTWLSAGAAGIPAGCPVIDPLLRQVSLAPYQTQSTATTYLVPAGCTADALRVTVQVGQNGTVLARRTADLVIVRPTAG